MHIDQTVFPTPEDLPDEPLTIGELLTHSRFKQTRADALEFVGELKRRCGRQNAELLLALAHLALRKAGLSDTRAARVMLRGLPQIKELLGKRQNAADDTKRIIWLRKRFSRRKGDAGAIYDEFNRRLSVCTDDEAAIAAAGALLALDDAISPARAP